MTQLNAQRIRIWGIAERQYDRISYEQLRSLGLSAAAIEHGVRIGLLFRVAHRVLSISRPRGTNEERWMTGVLASGPDAMVSHVSGLGFMRLGIEIAQRTHVSVPLPRHPRPRDVIIHRRSPEVFEERIIHLGIPVSSPALTIIDTAIALGEFKVEAAINEASQQDLATPASIKRTAARLSRIRGPSIVCRVLERDDFALSDSELERAFRRLLRKYGLPLHQTQRCLGNFRVDFIWPELGLVVECDSLRYHRTASKQRADAERDQLHAVAGLTTLRFTHWQVTKEPAVVAERLRSVMDRLAGGR